MLSKLSCIMASLLLLSSSVVWAETTVSDIQPSTPGEKQLLDAAKELEQTAPQAKAQAQEALTQAVNQANQMASQMQAEMSKAQNTALAPNPKNATPIPATESQQQAPQQVASPSPTNLEQAVAPNTLPNTPTPAQANVVAEQEVPMVDVVKKTHPMADLKLAGGLVVLAVLLLAWVFWQPKTKVQKAVAVADKKKGKQPRFTLPQEESHDEGEYDFLATEEAIPVKLDLARAYIDMDEAESARVVLQSVLEEGDSDQKSEAKALLKELELKL